MALAPEDQTYEAAMNDGEGSYGGVVRNARGRSFVCERTGLVSRHGETMRAPLAERNLHRRRGMVAPASLRAAGSSVAFAGFAATNGIGIFA